MDGMGKWYQFGAHKSLVGIAEETAGTRVGKKTLAILMTCHNRRDATVRCLESVDRQHVPEDLETDVYLVDDGSTDGTGEVVRRRYPSVKVLHGDGQLFWNGGMRLVFGVAMEKGYDFYLWLNDDTVLYPHAVAEMVNTYQRLRAEMDSEVIVVGSTSDPVTKKTTYGGIVSFGKLNRLKYRLLDPDPNRPLRCDSMNGNCVLIPAGVARRLGNLDRAYVHSMGDFDYGFRATRVGILIWTCPGYVGTCSTNPVSGSWRDATLPFRLRWKKTTGPKGLPVRSWWLLCRRHGGPLWPVVFVSPYVKVVIEGLVRMLARAIAIEAGGEALSQAGNRDMGSPRLAILNNVVPPYRVPIYRYLSRRYRTVVIVSGSEDNRKWDSKTVTNGLAVRTAWGISIKRRVVGGGGITRDLRYTHVNPGYIWELLKLRADAIITTEMGFRSLVAIIYGLIFRVPVWVWWGGTLHTERPRVFFKRFVRRYFFAKFARRWISYGTTSTEYLESIGVARSRILQIQNCVDDAMFLGPVEPRPIDVPRPRALFVGQLIGRKGIYQLLEASARLQHSGMQFSLVVVGDGPEVARFDAEAARLEVDRLHRIPYVAPEQMPSIYRSCDFLVFPTLEDVWGLVVNEALLSGIPVISSVYAGCAKELLPEENIFDPNDAAEFTETLKRALLGKIAPPDRGRIKSAREVAEMIAADIAATIGRGGDDISGRRRRFVAYGHGNGAPGPEIAM